MLVARRADKLTSVADEITGRGGDVRAVVGDVTDEKLRHRVFEETSIHFTGLDILVNNAGIGGIGPFAEANAERLRKILEINFIAPAEFIRAALPFLRKGRQPIIVNIGSVLGHVAVPWKSEYCASKFALRGFSDALRAELSPQGIAILHVAPSTTRTGFFEKSLSMETPHELGRWNSTSATVVARKTLRAIRQRKRELVISLGGKGLVGAHRFVPQSTKRLIERFVPQPRR